MPVPSKLPPLRNAALIVKAPTDFSFKHTDRAIQQFRLNPEDFSATIKGMKESRAEDVILDHTIGNKILTDNRQDNFYYFCFYISYNYVYI